MLGMSTEDQVSESLSNGIHKFSEAEEIRAEGDVKENGFNTEVEDPKASAEEEYLDILGSGQILKKTLSPGMGRDSRPTHGDLVTVEVEGRLKSTNAIVDPKQEMSFILGDGDVIQALDLGVTLAEKLEEFELETDARFAYGEKGREPDVPGNARLVYRVKLLKSDDAPDYATMSPSERAAASLQKRERGNYLYRREDFTLAVNSYSKAIKILEAGFPDRAALSKEQPEHFESLLTLLNNLAASQLKIEAYHGAIESCNFVLLHQQKNVKAIFRKGKAYMGLGELAKAMQLFREALDIEPDSRLARQELQRCKELYMEEREQHARLYKKMLGSKDESKDSGSDGTGKRGIWKKASAFVWPVVGVLVSGVSILLAIYLTQGSAPNLTTPEDKNLAN